MSQARAKLDHWNASGSAHGEPKISAEVFTEASSAQTNGTSTITDQPIRTTCEKTLTPTSPARPVPPAVAGLAGRRGGRGARVAGACRDRHGRPQYSIRSRRVARSMMAAMSRVKKNRTTPIADA